MSINDIHREILRNAVWILSTIMAFWGFWRFLRKKGVDSSYFGAVVIAEILYIAQAGLGLFLFLTKRGVLSRPPVHMLYGTVILLVLPGVYIYTRADETRRTILLYSLAFVFIIGISIRSMLTGN